MQQDHWFFVMASYAVVMAGMGGLLLVSAIRRRRIVRALEQLARDAG